MLEHIGAHDDRVSGFRELRIFDPAALDRAVEGPSRLGGRFVRLDTVDRQLGTGQQAPKLARRGTHIEDGTPTMTAEEPRDALMAASRIMVEIVFSRR